MLRPVILADGVTDSEGISEERFDGIEAFSFYLWYSAIDFHLSVNLIANAPRGGFFLAAEAVWCHAYVELAIGDL